MWLGGLIGLLLLWVGLGPHRRIDGLRVVVPRFSNIALGSVIVLAATGIEEAIEHLPAIDALWETGFGVAILVKTGLLLARDRSYSRETCSARSPGSSQSRKHPEQRQAGGGAPVAAVERERS